MKRLPLFAYVQASIIIGAATIAAVATRSFFEITNLAMMYVLAVVIVAVRYGRAPSTFAAVLAVAAFDWFCVPPYHTFAVADTQYIVTFAVMLFVSLVITRLTTRIAEQAEVARERERRTASLYAMSQTLASATAQQLVSAGVAHIASTFDADAALYLPDTEGELHIAFDSSSAFEQSGAERATAKQVFTTARGAGAGTDTPLDSNAVFLPLTGSRGALGTLGVRPHVPGTFSDASQSQQLQTFAALLAAAIERERLAEDARRVLQLEEMDRLKSEFVTVASHELRTPLTSLALEMELLRERLTTLGPRDNELLQAADEDVRKLRALTDDLLDLSRLEAGKAHFDRSAVSAAQLVAEAVDAFRTRAEHKQIQLATEIAADLPEVYADAAGIDRVFANLIANAIRHTDAGGRIVVAADCTDGAVQFSVADNGHGIPLAEQNRLFDRFVRLENGAARNGTGLGLAISRQIVRAHGGDMWVDSAPGRGSVFSFTIPVNAQRGEPALDAT
jgi:two-component system sensor histidine kinase KdpD